MSAALKRRFNFVTVPVGPPRYEVRTVVERRADGGAEFCAGARPAVALPNGEVLVAGGRDASGAPVETLELFTPPAP